MKDEKYDVAMKLSELQNHYFPGCQEFCNVLSDVLGIGVCDFEAMCRKLSDLIR